MPWTAQAPNAGFTDGTPWLPIPAEQRAAAVDVQQDDPGSVLAAYREAIALRKRQPALATGSIRFFKAAGPVMSFVRESADERVLCVFNLSAQPAAWPRDAILRALRLPADALANVDSVLPGWEYRFVPIA